MKKPPALNGKKYKLDEFLNKLSKKDYDITMRRLPRLLKIGHSTFRSWRNLQISDQRQIPGEHLIAISRYFEVSPEEMVNVKIPTYNIIILRKMEQEQLRGRLNLISN